MSFAKVGKKKIIRWFNETGGEGKEFDYRFKDSRFFL